MKIKVKSGTSLNDKELDSLMLSLSEYKVGFPFGTAVKANLIVDNSVENKKYSDFVVNNFNYAVIENALKWPQWEPQRNVFNKAKIDAALDWLDSKGIPTRGHNLIWETRLDRLPKWVRNLKGRKMRKAVKHRINTAVSNQIF